MIAVGCDHAGYELKEKIKSHLADHNVEFNDLGTYSSESVDYPDIAKKLCLRVASGEFDKGILVCGTGIGMCIASNKVPGIRAVVCSDTYSAKLCRLHNDANLLCLGQRVIGDGLASMICDEFLSTPFEGGRHANRVKKLNELDNLPRG